MRYISENISWNESIKSSTAKKKEIDNIPDEQAIQNMKKLAKNIFEPLRQWANEPIRVNSFFAKLLDQNRQVNIQKVKQLILMLWEKKQMQIFLIMLKIILILTK